jgi:hypothetical protein
MLEIVRSDSSERKLRLFSLACCHRIEPQMLKDRNWGRWFLETVAVIDRCFEGAGSEAELLELYDIAPNEPANQVIAAILTPNAWEGAARASRSAAVRAGWCIDEWANWNFSEWRKRAERAVQARRFRCIFGNPFRPVSFSPEWRSGTTVALAGQMYESRDFSAMPILADAFQDAGCDNDHILSHCRGPGPHVRGCWVVDSVLGKE